jgi:hypothetical protein
LQAGGCGRLPFDQGRQRESELSGQVSPPCLWGRALCGSKRRAGVGQKVEEAMMRPLSRVRQQFLSGSVTVLSPFRNER